MAKTFRSEPGERTTVHHPSKRARLGQKRSARQSLRRELRELAS